MGTSEIRVAIFIASDLESGGGYQYERLVIRLLEKYHNDPNIQINYFTMREDLLCEYKDLGIEVKVIKENFVHKLHRLSLSNQFFLKIFKKFGFTKSKIEKKLVFDKIDIVYFPSPSLIPRSFRKLPFINTIWDLGHLEHLEFPELSGNGVFEGREELYNNGLRKAFRVIVDSDYLKKYAVEKYRLDAKRVQVLKFLPSIRDISDTSEIDVKSEYGIKNNYIFYPAQFWPHKNHIYILKAIKILREEYSMNVDMVFSGSDKGNLHYVLDMARELGVIDLVHYLGFVREDHIAPLYKQSIALVMPTYLGPTNIPPLEAFYYKTPVCYSDTPSFRDQTQDAAFYIDISDPRSLVKQLLTIQTDQQLVINNVEKGLRVIAAWTDRDFYHGLHDTFEAYRKIRECWY